MKQIKNEQTTEISPELLELAKGGNRDALSELYEKTHQDIYRTVHSMIRDEDLTLDIQQDTYLKAFSRLDQLRDAASFLPWLRKIAVNEARAQLCKKRPLAFSELSGEEEEAVPELPDLSPEGSPELALDRKETNRLIREILSGLSDGQRMLLGMFYYEQLPLNKIAEDTGLSVGTIKTQLHRGRKRVETEVRKLEAQGVKLYGLSPMPFLLALMKRQSPTVKAGEAVLTKTLARAGAVAGAKAVAVSGGAGAAVTVAETVTLHTSRSFFETVAGRIVLGVIAAGVLAGGAAGYRWAKDALHQKPNPILLMDTSEDLVADPTAPTAPEERVSELWDSDVDTEEDLVTEPETTEPPTEPTEPKPTDAQPTEPQPTYQVDPNPAEEPPTDGTDPDPTEPFDENEQMALGSCGDNLTWALDKTSGVLTITGSGPMEDFLISPWFDFQEYVTTVILPQGMTHIGNGAFNCFYGLNRVVLPETLTSIGEYAFACCPLTSVAFPDGLTSIGAGAFCDCRLTSLTFPESLTSIGPSAFRGNKIKNLVLPNCLETLDDNAFSECTELTSVILPASLEYFGTEAFSQCKKLASITIPEGLKIIGNSAFSECGNLSSITLPEGLEIIGDNAFSYSNNLTSVTLPESLKIIGDNAFSYSGITCITLPKRLTSIGDGTFCYCKNLTSIVIPESVEEIGLATFFRCISLQSVTLPEDLKTIRYLAFADCPALTSVTIPASVSVIDDPLGFYAGYGPIEGFTIYGVEGSEAQSYAKRIGLRFIPR